MSAGRSWGRLPQAEQRLIPLSSRFECPQTSLSPMLAYGNGRSYGDVCLNAGGTLLLTRGLDRFIAFDPLAGTIDCEAGVLLNEIIDLVLPHGWFLPVVPGTAHVTVGGAIANDVHGKNHHRFGSFGNHVLQLELLSSSGHLLRCSPSEDGAWFRATVGGMGLTGLIQQARIQLRPVPGPWIHGRSQRFSSLREFFGLARAFDSEYEYGVAWVDCSASGAALGRGIYTCGNHARDLAPVPKRHALRFPVTPPISLANAVSLRLFNKLYYWRPAAESVQSLWHYQSFLFPLDGIRDWNRMYGPKGFFQYQCVVPESGADDALREILQRIAQSGLGSFLVVLKTFGHNQPAGLMSFPRSGVTLAVDFPNRGRKTLALLESLDEVTRAARGAVYPAKDARMSAASFQQFFPAWRQFLKYRDPQFSSSFWRRVTGQSKCSEC
jgi:FAD/FMN-containing dehydrogenase